MSTQINSYLALTEATTSLPTSEAIQTTNVTTTGPVNRIITTKELINFTTTSTLNTSVKTTENITQIYLKFDKTCENIENCTKSTIELNTSTEHEEVTKNSAIEITHRNLTTAPEDDSDDSDDSSTFNILWILCLIIPIILLLIFIKCKNRLKDRQRESQPQTNCETVIDTTGFHDVSLHSSQSIPSLEQMPNVFNTQSANNHWPSHNYYSTHEDLPPSYESITAKIK